MAPVFLAAVLLAVVFLLHCAVVGGAVMRCLSNRNGAAAPFDDGLALFFSICLGMLANMLALFALGMVGALHGPAVSAMALALLLAGWFATRHGPPLCQRPSGITLRISLEIATLAVFLLLCVAASMHPPGHWDDTMYQLPLARAYVDQQAIVLNEYLRFPLFPQHFNMLFAVGMMLGDGMPAWVFGLAGAEALWRFGTPEIFAQVFATLPLFVIVLGLWGASHRYMGSGVPGLLAGLVLFLLVPVASNLGFAYVDNGLALFCWAAVLALAGAAQQPHVDSRLYACAGLLAGAACGIKYFGVVFAAVLGLAVIVVAALQARRPGPVLRAAVSYGVAIVVAGGGWYLHSYLVSGDPVHPAGASVFGFFLWNEGDLVSQSAEQATYGVQRTLWNLPSALMTAGVWLWAPAFAGLFIRRLSPAIRLFQAVFVGYFLFWFFVTQVPRYLAPVYGLGGFLTLHALWYARQRLGLRIGAGRLAGTLGGAWRHTLVVALVLIGVAAYAGDRGIKYGNRYTHAETELAGHRGYTLYKQASMHAAQYGNRLVQIGFEGDVYFFSGVVIGDWFGPGRYRELLECDPPPCRLPPPAQLQESLQKHGARMLMLSRERIPGQDITDLQTAGWRLLSENDNGALLVSPAPASPTPPDAAPASASRPTESPGPEHKT